MVIIDNKRYEYKRLHRLEEIARAMIHKPYSSFLHFSFLCNKSKIIAVGWNDVSWTSIKINKEIIKYPLGGIHSEAHAIKRLKRFDEAPYLTLVNVRLNHKKELRNSKPCEYCMKIINAAGIRKVYYSTNEGFEFLDLRK
jgi:deoxycytidylate deaminase